MSDSQPLPEGGWSREIVTVRNALICPPTVAVQRPLVGVFSDGVDCPNAALWRGGVRMTLGADPEARPVRRLEGRHIWGGMFFGHFGHFMTETMSRCWAFGQEAETVVFVPKHGKLTNFKAAYRLDYWNLLGLDKDVTIAAEPIEVEELLVPGQGFGLGKIARGTPEFRKTMQELTARVPDDEPRKIYISRTKFLGRGGIIAEQAVEENMARHGYTVMYPERMALIDQLRFYKSATHIVGVDSSAFHIAGMVADPSKKFGFILRRENNAHEWIALQLEGMTGSQPIIMNSLVAHWMEEQQAHTNHLSWGELDQGLLASQLEEHGFINDASDWILPTPEAVKDSIEYASHRSLGPGLVRKPAKRIIT